MLYALKRQIIAIGPRDAGMPRVLFVVGSLLLGLAGIVLLMMQFFAGSWQAVLVDVRSSGSFGALLQDQLLAGVYFTAALTGLTFAISLLLMALGKRKNSFWYELKTLGERKIGGFDGSLLVFALLFLVANLVTGHVNWVTVFFGPLALLLLIVNMLKKDALLAPPAPPLPDWLEIEEEEEAVEETDLEYHNYKWKSSLGGPFQLNEQPLRKSSLDALRKQNEAMADKGYYSSGELIEIVQTGSEDPDVRKVCRNIMATHQEALTIQRMDNLLQFVHQFPYSYDKDSTKYDEYARYPLETLADETGDCECLAILLASLFKLHGYNTVLIELSSKTGGAGHVMTGVEVPGGAAFPGNWIEQGGIQYFACEATGTHWRIGEADFSKYNVESLSTV